MDRPYGNGLTSDQLTFVAMYAQIHGGGPGRGADDAAHREHYFAHCLDAIVPALPRIESIAFPKYIGCEIAGGNWDNYGRMLRQFAGLHPHLQVFIVERGPIARMNGQPISPAQHHRVPGSQSSRSVPTSSASHRPWSGANAPKTVFPTLHPIAPAMRMHRCRIASTLARALRPIVPCRSMALRRWT